MMPFESHAFHNPDSPSFGSAVRFDADRVVAVVAKVSEQGWETSSQRSSDRFAQDLIQRAMESCEAVPSAVDVARVFERVITPLQLTYVDWASAEFSVLTVAGDEVTVAWLGDVSGSVHIDGQETFRVYPHTVSLGDDHRELSVVTKFVSTTSRHEPEVLSALRRTDTAVTAFLSPNAKCSFTGFSDLAAKMDQGGSGLLNDAVVRTGWQRLVIRIFPMGQEAAAELS